MSVFRELMRKDYSGPPHICVEMSGNHQSELEHALEFMRKAAIAGADSMKVQVYTPDTITLDSNKDDFKLKEGDDWSEYKNLYDLYKKAHTPWSWIEKIFERAYKYKLPIFASPFDSSSVEFLEELGCEAYKIASPEITDIGLIEKCAKTGKPVILSTGLAVEEDLDLAVALLRDLRSDFAILKCVSAYPTPINQMNLSIIPWLEKNYSCSVGLSDHTIGREAAFAATALGAKIIEKHFKLDSDQTSIDAKFSMSLDELRDFKNQVSLVHQALGTPKLSIAKAAEKSLSGRRSLYAVRDIEEGEVFTEENIRSIRPSFGLPPRYLKQIMGLRAIKKIDKGDRLSKDLISGFKIGET